MSYIFKEFCDNLFKYCKLTITIIKQDIFNGDYHLKCYKDDIEYGEIKIKINHYIEYYDIYLNECTIKQKQLDELIIYIKQQHHKYNDIYKNPIVWIIDLMNKTQEILRERYYEEEAIRYNCIPPPSPLSL